MREGNSYVLQKLRDLLVAVEALTPEQVLELRGYLDEEIPEWCSRLENSLIPSDEEREREFAKAYAAGPMGDFIRSRKKPFSL